MIETLEELCEAAYGEGRRREPMLCIKKDGSAWLVSKVQVGESRIAPFLARELVTMGILGAEPGFYSAERLKGGG